MLIGLSRSIDRVTAAIGRSVSWLIVAAVILSAGNAVVRKLFATSSNAWLEAQWWLFALVFLLASPWTLAENEHVRIDVVNNRFPKWGKNAVELIGHVFFLLPAMAMLALTSWHYFMTSLAQNEQSSNAGGLPQWPIKALIPLAFALLFVQGLSELIKRLAIMRGELEERTTHSGFHERVVQTGEDLAAPSTASDPAKPASRPARNGR